MQNNFLDIPVFFMVGVGKKRRYGPKIEVTLIFLGSLFLKTSSIKPGNKGLGTDAGRQAGGRHCNATTSTEAKTNQERSVDCSIYFGSCIVHATTTAAADYCFYL